MRPVSYLYSFSRTTLTPGIPSCLRRIFSTLACIEQ